MEWLVAVGATIAVLALAAVIWLRWGQKPTGGRRRTGTARPKQKEAWTRSEKISLAGIVIGATLSLAGLLSAGGGSDNPGKAADSQPSPIALSALLRQGPFAQSLPNGLRGKELRSVDIGDSSASSRVDALELVIDTENGPPDIGAFAEVEVYQTPEEAIERAEARIALLKRIFGDSAVQGGARSYCSLGTINGPDAWECGGTSGLTYAQAAVAPSGNAFQSLATGITSALLRYADEKARVAAS